MASCSSTTSSRFPAMTRSSSRSSASVTPLRQSLPPHATCLPVPNASPQVSWSSSSAPSPHAHLGLSELALQEGTYCHESDHTWQSLPCSPYKPSARITLDVPSVMDRPIHGNSSGIAAPSQYMDLLSLF
jgi:hypothetical protein